MCIITVDGQTYSTQRLQFVSWNTFLYMHEILHKMIKSQWDIKRKKNLCKTTLYFRKRRPFLSDSQKPRLIYLDVCRNYYVYKWFLNFKLLHVEMVFKLPSSTCMKFFTKWLIVRWIWIKRKKNLCKTTFYFIKSEFLSDSQKLRLIYLDVCRNYYVYKWFQTSPIWVKFRNTLQ